MSVRKKGLYATFFCWFVVFAFSGCSTSRGVVVPGELHGAEQIGSALEDLRSKQDELGVAGAIIEDRSAGIAYRLSEFESSIRRGAEGSDVFTEIIRNIRSRPVEDTFIKEYSACRLRE